MTMPPLPEVNYLGDDVSYGYDACDMHAYGEACAAAERERIKFELLVAHERAQGRHNYYLCAVQEIFATDAAIRAQEKT